MVENTPYRTPEACIMTPTGSERQMLADWEQHVADDYRDDEEEEWRPVVGDEAYYEVSESGRVRRIAGGQGSAPGRCLAPIIDSQGYALYNLNSGGNRSRRRAHRLVADAFHGPANELPLCRHLDGNRLNNHYTNLRWGTAQENSDDRTLHGRNTGWNESRTHCKSGHEYTPENTRMKHETGKRPFRVCRTCHKKWQGKAA